MAIQEFGSWTPDLPAIGFPHMRIARNVLPAKKAYEPLPSLTATSNALDAKCRGATGARDIEQNAHMFAGDATKLYKLIDFTWTDYSQVGGYGPAVDTTRWRYTTFGDRLIATNGIDPPQYIDMSTAATAFADLPGSPGAAQFAATYGEFVFLGAIASSVLAIKWSGFGDSEGWTPGTNQSDEQEFADGGRITGLIATKAVLYVFQEKCIRRVFYVGGDVIFTIDKIVDGIGCVEPNSLVSWGQIMFFLAESGWYMWDGESQPVSIGNEAFDEWFISDSTRTYWYTMSAAVDPRRKVVAWGYASTNTGSGVPDSILFFNYAVGKASYARIDHEFLMGALSLGVGLDSLDAEYPSIDAMTLSFDDPAFQGGTFYLSAFKTDHKLASFSGANLEATLETGEFPLFDGQRARVQWLKPIFTGDSAGAVTAAAAGVVRSGDQPSYGSQVAQQASGRCPQRGANGFFSSAKYVAPAASVWTAAMGHDFAAVAAGVR